MIKVCKFGGTSMADENAIRKVKEIIDADKSRKYVVVSAPGKRFAGDEKIENLKLFLSQSFRLCTLVFRLQILDKAEELLIIILIFRTACVVAVDNAPETL